MTSARALSALARVTLTRTLRKKTLWVAGVIALLPTVFAVSVGSRSMISSADDVYNVCKILLGIIPPVFVAAAIGEEIEDRTATYLWSRPLARWTVIVGKLIALVPIVVVVMAASWLVPAVLVLHNNQLAVPAVEPALVLAAGGVAVSMTSAGIASLVPKHGMALTIIYILADLTIGALPTSIAKISMTYHVGEMVYRHADSHDKLMSAAALAAIGTAWLVAGLRRIRRAEV